MADWKVRRSKNYNNNNNNKEITAHFYISFFKTCQIVIHLANLHEMCILVVLPPVPGQPLRGHEVQRRHGRLEGVDQQQLHQQPGAHARGDVEARARKLVGPGSQEAGGGLAYERIWCLNSCF